jgi:hypothetical protein
MIKRTLLLLCILTTPLLANDPPIKADDDYETIVRFLGEHGHYIISPDDVAKVQAFMKANGYQHVSEIPKNAAAAFDSTTVVHNAAEPAPSTATLEPRSSQATQTTYRDGGLDETFQAIVKIEKRFEHVHDTTLPLFWGRERALELLKMAEYTLSDAELTQVCDYMHEYGVQHVLKELDENEISFLRFRYLSTGTPEEINQVQLELAAIAKEGGSSDLDNFLTQLVFKKYGLVKEIAPLAITTNPKAEEAKTTATPEPAKVTSTPIVEGTTSPKVEATLTLTPMTKEEKEKFEQRLEQERITKEQAKRKRYEKEEAEREANGDFSQAPGLTPEQREAAEIRWGEKMAKESIKGEKPAPQ